MDESELAKLIGVWEELAARERNVLQLFAARLLQGQRVYGPLTSCKRKWSREAVEEAIDYSAYMAFLALDMSEEP
jgi:hypothetical protein